MDLTCGMKCSICIIEIKPIYIIEFMAKLNYETIN